MSLERAYNLARAFVGQEWARINGVEREAAELELAQPVIPKPAAQDTSQREVATPAITPGTARQMLGVAENAPFSEIRASFERLFERADPAKFAGDAEAERQATLIRERIVASYNVLCQGQNNSDLRFGSLDLD